ncbi:MAG: glycosyltransferase family 4 protein, partial [Janthinobacterium lividum]
PDKGPDLFIAACAKAMPHLPGWRAEMIGADGFSAAAPDSEFIRGLRPAAAAAGVAMHGARPHAEVLRAMSRAAIVVVPSRWQEPFGLTALEAMACGAALVCSGRGGLAEVVGDAGLLTDPEDADGFARALLELAGDAGLRAALSAAGVERARSRFSVADAVARMDGLRDQASRL